MRGTWQPRPVRRGSILSYWAVATCAFPVPFAGWAGYWRTKGTCVTPMFPASSTVRSLADESFGVVVVEDCCAAATMDLHERELEIINMIYCQVVTLDELTTFFQPAGSPPAPL